ncbi:pentatricopeptide repeat-containing protein At4g21705, mitochondrial [Lotus japonicus]|uniref:pentatricopeptide repeat-containing protein At4g21705, mitochondrial n=1 Tax=Lotus japonicus TaxID=34305 RepID=UPI00258FDD5E|nr:pentatricopeptide repeat-containing protein At4g21705, mitochondrial [Lotus japonicus]
MGLKLLQRIATAIEIGKSSRSYYTSRTKKPSLYSKISPLGNPNTSVVGELDDWVYKGNKVRVGELQRLIRDLRKRSRFSQALQVSEWMNKNGVCIFSPTEHAVHLDLIGKVHGFSSAESYFDSLKEQDKTEKAYGALLNCYVRQRLTDKSLAHFQKMKELGFASLSLTYNDIMCLYTNVGQHEKVRDVLNEMKENQVLPDNFSYRICINSYGMRQNIDGMEEILKEMESQPHIVMDWNTYSVVANSYIKAGLTSKAVGALRKSEERLNNKDGEGYNHLISLYARLGQKNEVLRLWDLEKSACKRCLNRDFVTVLESLVKLAEFDEAEKILKEWESSGNCYDYAVPNTLIMGYSDNGFPEKAEAILEDLPKKGKATTPNWWTIVASSYLHKGEMEKALECLKTSASLCAENKGRKPNPKVVAGLLSWIGNKSSVEDAEVLVSLLRNIVSVNSLMYHALIKSYLRAGKEVDELLDRMKKDDINENEETKKILSIKKA